MRLIDERKGVGSNKGVRVPCGCVHSFYATKNGGRLKPDMKGGTPSWNAVPRVEKVKEVKEVK